MTVKKLFKKVPYEELWKEYVKIENLDEEKYPYDKLGRKTVFDFIKEYVGVKSKEQMIVCIKDCEEFLAVSGFRTDAKLPCEFEKMTNDNLWDIETYALECSEIYEWAYWEIFEKSIETYGEIMCAAYILYEMTYHGTTEEARKERLKNYYEYKQ